MHMFSWSYVYSFPKFGFKLDSIVCTCLVGLMCTQFQLAQNLPWAGDLPELNCCASRGVSVTGGFECKLIFFSRIAIGSVSVYFIRLSLVCHLAVFRETCFELGAMETIPNSRVLIPYSSEQWHWRRTRSCSWSTGSATLCRHLKCWIFFSYPFPEVNFVIDCVNL